MGLELRLTLECSVCKQNFDEARTMDVNTIVKLFGAKNYYVQCCCCGQDVEGSDDWRYRRRWERWAHRLVRERIVTLKKLLAERD